MSHIASKQQDTQVATPREAPAPPRKGIVLAVCCLSVFIAGVSVSVVNVALPAVQHSFDASVSGLQWIVDIYTLVVACLLMLSGSLADRLGRRRVFLTGLAVFTIGSLACSVAPSLGWAVSRILDSSSRC